MRPIMTLGLTAILAATGCVGAGECYDCGPCGIIGGPATTDEIFGYVPGADPTGAAALGILGRRGGECEADSQTIVRFSGGVPVVSTDDAPIDRAGATLIESAGDASVYRLVGGVDAAFRWETLRGVLHIDVSGAASGRVECSPAVDAPLCAITGP